MDKLYIGDIPLTDSDDVVLFYNNEGFPVICQNISSLSDDDNVHTYILLNNVQNNKFIYETRGTQVSLIRSNVFYKVKVSNKWYDRPDCLNILCFSVCICLATVFIINIFTSIFKKGGLLGGLL